MALSKSVKNAIKLGSLCTISYFAVYVARNVLSAITPALLLLGYTENYIKVYALGQLKEGKYKVKLVKPYNDGAIIELI